MKSIISTLFFLLVLTFGCFAQPNVINQLENKITVLLGHRYSGGFNPVGYEQYVYVGLFKNENNYYLKPTKVKVNLATDKCSGDSTFTIHTAERKECLFLFWGLKWFTDEPILSHYIAPTRRFILPQKKYTFTFDRENYSFEGFGTIEGDNINDYRLVLNNESKKQMQLMVSEELLVNSKVEILFIGDLDGDKKPDFIINAPPYSETRNIMLFLSTHAEKGHIVKCVSQQFDWFDC